MGVRDGNWERRAVRIGVRLLHNIVMMSMDYRGGDLVSFPPVV